MQGKHVTRVGESQRRKYAIATFFNTLTIIFLTAINLHSISGRFARLFYRRGQERKHLKSIERPISS